MAYKVEFSPGVLRQLKKLSNEIEAWVFDVAERLASTQQVNQPRAKARGSNLT